MSYTGRNRFERCVRASLVLALATGWCALGASPKRVLILDSFGRDVTPYNAAVSAFRTTLALELGEGVDIYETALDMARFSDPGFEGPLLNFIDQRFAGRPFDLVVPVGAPAVRFAAEHRSRFAGQPPVVFTAADPRLIPGIALETNATLVTQQIDLPRMMEDMLRLRPDTTNILVVFGASQLERYWADESRREWQVFTNRLRMVWTQDLSLQEILHEARQLPPRSFVFFGLMLMDADRIPYDYHEALKKIHAAANAPLYAPFQSQFGHGAIGGSLYRNVEIGTQAARVGIRILRGEQAANIPPEILVSAPPVYDWRELTRWGVTEDRLAPGSRIEYRQPTFWELYRGTIIGVLSVCFVEAGLICWLVRSLIKRRRAEESLRRSQEQFALAAEGANDGLWDWDIQGNRVYYSPRWKNMLGYTDGEVPPTVAGWENLVHPEDKSRALAAIEECLQGPGASFQLEHRLRHRDGSFRWILSRGKLLRDGNGRPRRMAGSHTDITERRRTEQELRQFNARLINAQEKERSRLARELHDDITQRLARLAIDVGSYEIGTPGPGPAQTARAARQELVRLSEDVHALSYRLHPSILEDLGLAPALKAEADRVQRQNSVSVDVRLDELPETLSFEMALCIFRIAQEALRNATRHGGAKKLSVLVRRLEDALQLAVQDDGCGFDPNQPKARAGLGLASMRERAGLLGGTLEIDSSPGHGTLVLAWVPLHKPES